MYYADMGAYGHGKGGKQDALASKLGGHVPTGKGENR